MEQDYPAIQALDSEQVRMVIDVHVHCKGGEDGNKVLKAMDAVARCHIRQLLS